MVGPLVYLQLLSLLKPAHEDPQIHIGQVWLSCMVDFILYVSSWLLYIGYIRDLGSTRALHVVNFFALCAGVNLFCGLFIANTKRKT
jgi:hypothetical protein